MTNKTKAIIKTVVMVVGTIISYSIGMLISKLIEYFIGDWLNLVIGVVLIIVGAFWIYQLNLKETQDED